MRDNINNMEKSKSPFKLGAERGLILGAVLCIAFLASVPGMGMPLASLLMFGLMTWIPIMVFLQLRAARRSNLQSNTFSSLWLQGIITFICGALIASAFAMLYFRFIDPDFVINTVDFLHEQYAAMPGQNAKEMSKIFANMKANGAVPSPGTMVIGMFWVMVSSGAILSMLLASIARFTPMGKSTADACTKKQNVF